MSQHGLLLQAMQLAISTGLHEFDELSELRLVGLAAMVSKLPWALYILAVTSPVQFGTKRNLHLGPWELDGICEPQSNGGKAPGTTSTERNRKNSPLRTSKICLQQKYMNIY